MINFNKPDGNDDVEVNLRIETILKLEYCSFSKKGLIIPYYFHKIHYLNYQTWKNPHYSFYTYLLNLNRCLLGYLNFC